jgi:ribosome recycling factor
MDLFFKTKLNSAEKKMGSYMTLLHFRYQNLCVKAELGSLMPVTVAADKEYNIEDVAKVATPDEYRLEVYPNHEDYQKPIIEAIFDVHPEFKMEVVDDPGDTGTTHIVYTMPDVNKDRRDLLKNTAKVFYEECNIEIEKECGKYITSLSDLDGRLPMEEVSEISMVLKHIREDYREKSNDLYQQKLAEIEEGYQQYLSKEEKTVTNEQIDFKKGFRMNPDNY